MIKKGNNKNMTEGYKQIPFSDRLSSDFPTGKVDCVMCNGEGEVQCCAGEHYYNDDCSCVLIQYWENKGNDFMVDGYKKILANNIKLRSM